MEKYIFTRNFDWTSPLPACAKANPPCSVSRQGRSFKKGDIIEGNVVANTQSEPPNIFESGNMRIGFGGRAGSVIAPYLQAGSPTNDGSGRQTTVPVKGDSHPDGLVMGLYRGGLIIGGLAGLGIGYGIAKKKNKDVMLGALIGGLAGAGLVVLYNVKFGYKFDKIVL